MGQSGSVRGFLLHGFSPLLQPIHGPLRSSADLAAGALQAIRHRLFQVAGFFTQGIHPVLDPVAENSSLLAHRASYLLGAVADPVIGMVHGIIGFADHVAELMTVAFFKGNCGHGGHTSSDNSQQDMGGSIGVHNRWMLGWWRQNNQFLISFTVSLMPSLIFFDRASGIDRVLQVAASLPDRITGFLQRTPAVINHQQNDDDGYANS